MKAGTLIVYDVETGGFKASENPICEIALVVVDVQTLEIVEKYCKVVAPYTLSGGVAPIYTPGALKVNGLTMSKIEAGTPRNQVVDEIVAIAKKYSDRTSKPILVGHNIDKFDNDFLIELLQPAKLNVFGQIFSPMRYDTLGLSTFRWANGETVDHKLGTVCSKIGVDLLDAHSALPDTEATAKLMIDFIKAMRGQGSSSVQEVQESKVRVGFLM